MIQRFLQLPLVERFLSLSLVQRFLKLLLILPALAGSYSHSNNLLVNPGFESGSGQSIDGWKASAYINDSGHSAYSIDGDSHSGHNSLKIFSFQENDFMLTQDVPVEGGHAYKLSGWVKTENVQSLQGKIGANLCIARSFIRTASLKGTQPWTEVECYFRITPNRTSVPITCRLGFTNSVATGGAWFDDIELSEIQLPTDSNLPQY